MTRLTQEREKEIRDHWLTPRELIDELDALRAERDQARTHYGDALFEIGVLKGQIKEIADFTNSSAVREIYNWGSTIRKIGHLANKAIGVTCPNNYWRHKCEDCDERAKINSTGIEKKDSCF